MFESVEGDSKGRGHGRGGEIALLCERDDGRLRGVALNVRAARETVHVDYINVEIVRTIPRTIRRGGGT